MDEVIAVDLGGTNIRAARVGEDGQVLARARIATAAAEGMDAVMGRIAGLVKSVRSQAVKAVGLGTPGVPDPFTGRMRLAAVHIPGSADYPMTGELSARTGLKAACENDGSLAALGESWLGAGRGEPVVLADHFAGLLWGNRMLGLLLDTAARPSARETAAQAEAATEAFLRAYPAP